MREIGLRSLHVTEVVEESEDEEDGQVLELVSDVDCFDLSPTI